MPNTSRAGCFEQRLCGLHVFEFRRRACQAGVDGARREQIVAGQYRSPGVAVKCEKNPCSQH